MESTSSVPRISVIIPNLHSSVIDQTLQSLRQQSLNLSQVEVLVVGLDEPGLVNEDALVRMISTGEPVGPAVARNIGIRHAHGEVICFTDADCVAERDWLAQFVKALADDSVDVVGGGVTFESDNYWSLCDNLGWFYRVLDSLPPGKRSLFPTLNLCVRRKVIEAVGLMNETYPCPAGEDAEWTTRMRQAGFDLYFWPQAVIHHHPSRASLKDIWRHAYTYGRYSIKVDPRFADFLKTSFVFRHWWGMLFVMPAMSVWAALRIFLNAPAAWRYFYAFPGILVGKIAWIFGAMHTLRHTAARNSSERLV